MGKYKLTDPKSGATDTIEAPSPEEAKLEFSTRLKSGAYRSTGEKIQRGRQETAAQFRGGLEGIAGAAGDAPGMFGSATEWIANKIPTVTDEQAAGAGDLMRSTARTGIKAVTGGYAADILIKSLEAAGIISPETSASIRAQTEPPTSQEVHGMTSAVLPDAINKGTEPLQDPNRWEQGAGFAAGMMPNLLGGPGGGVRQAITRFGTRVAAPTAVESAISPITDRLVAEGKLSQEDATAIKLATQAVTGGAGGMMEKGLATRQAAQLADTNPAALREVYEGLVQDGMNPDDARAVIAKFGGGRSEGGEAMIVDLGQHGNIEQLGVKSGSSPGPGGSELKQKLEDRSKSAGQRIRSDQQEAMGPSINRDIEMDRFQKRAQRVGSQYDLAKKNQVRPSATQSIADDLDSELAVARGPMRGPLEEIRKSLDLPGAPGNLDPSAEGMHQMRQAIDQHLDAATPGTPLFNRLTHYRKLVDAELKDIAPRMKELDTRYSRIKGEEEAFEAGEEALSKAGKVVPSPDEFKTTWDKMEPREKQAALKGANRWVDQQTGLTNRERVKLKSVIGGDWNEAKLKTMIGEEKTNRLIAAIEREDVFQDRYQRIVHNSKTASAVDQGNPSMTSGMGQVGAATTLTTGSPMAGVTAAGLTGAKNWISKKLNSVEAGQRLKSDIGKLLASDAPEDVFRAMEALKKADSTAVLPRAMQAALLARMEETGHR